MATKRVSFLVDDPLSPIKHSAGPPGYEVTTTVTSSGTDGTTKPDKCQQHRARYPEAEALVQLFFRFAALGLHIAVLIIVFLLDKNYGHGKVKIIYGFISYCMTLDTLESLSLLNPRLRIPALTHGPLKHPGYVFKYKRFPRLPSLFLFVFELIATVMIWVNIAMLLGSLRDNANDETREALCPFMTCVTPEEAWSVYAFVMSELAALIHFGFWMMPGVHWLKRKVPQWYNG